MMTSKSKKIYESLVVDYPHALQSITSLSKNSSDKRNFIVSDVLGFNFDLIYNLCIAFPDCKEKSPDALFLHNETLYFIEFKEGVVKKDDIRLKIHEAIVSLYQYSITKKIATKEDFIGIDIRYAIIMRSQVNGDPPQSFLDTLEASATHFNLKNLEGFLVKKTRIAFRPKSILELLNKVSGGAIFSIDIMSRDQQSAERCEISENAAR